MKEGQLLRVDENAWYISHGLFSSADTRPTSLPAKVAAARHDTAEPQTNEQKCYVFLCATYMYMHMCNKR